MFNQELSFVGKRNLQAMGATDCLEGQSNGIFTPFTDHLYSRNTCSKAQGWLSKELFTIYSNETDRAMAEQLFSSQSWRCQRLSQSLPWWFFLSYWQWDQSSWSLSWWPLSAGGERTHLMTKQLLYLINNIIELSSRDGQLILKPAVKYCSIPSMSDAVLLINSTTDLIMLNFYCTRPLKSERCWGASAIRPSEGLS